MSNSSNFLIIPLRIEGLCLDHPQQVASPIADFSKLPWSNGSEDFNFSQPFVSNGVLREPFEEPGLILKKGVHLHFIIPHFLGQAIPSLKGLANSGDLPAAPNRWLVTINDSTQYIIESDYVHEANYQPDNSSCVIPSSSNQPFRYMGRKTPLSASRTAGTDFKTFTGKDLTVVGYGDINFSSFYPNCMGAFGFHDPGGTATGVSYKVLGWHENATDDVLSQYIIKAMSNDNSITFDQLNDKLSDGFNLELGGSALPANTVRTLFYGEFTADSQNSKVKLSPLEIAVGHTGTEALAAHLANEMAAGNTANKQTIEEQIEAALMNDQLDPLKVDTAPKFLEGRHAKGFRPINASDLWQITTSAASPNPSPVDNSVPPMILPATLEPPLDALNNLQQQYDKAQNQIKSLRVQLYSDWYRYMHTRYTPLEARGQYADADLVMNFVQNGSLNELNQLVASTGTLTFGDGVAGNQPATTSASTTLAAQLVTAWNTLNGLIGDQNTTRTTDHLPNLQLALMPGPRYWEVHDPVILISGLDQASTGTNPTLAGSISATPISSSQSVSAQSLSTTNTGDILTQCAADSSITKYQLSTQQWSPFILDWQIDLEGIHLKQGGSFKSKGLSQNYNLNPYGPDFINNNEAPGKLSVFSGTVLMSSHAKHSLRQQIKNFLKDFFKKNKIGYTGSNTIDTFLDAPGWWASGSATDAYNVLNIPSTFTQISTDTTFSTNPIYTLWKSYGSLKNKEVLSQTLNGFNEACIMQKKVPQIPIMEPLGFHYEQEFTSNVATAVGNNRSMSPITAFQFNPIRGGNLSFNQLDLIDNFGTIHTLDTSTIKVVNSETISDAEGKTKLLPRLSQAARLNFRWLSAQTGISETNIHPGSSPICGWLTADYINNSVAVYAPDGTALGALDSQAHWTPPPWDTTSSLAGLESAYPYLYKVVEKIKGSATFLQDFILACQNAQQNIAPADAHLYTTKSILMGKPMAVVRAKLSFETKGLPVIDQSWASLLSDMDNFDQNAGSYSSRNNEEWTKVQFNIRIGEHHQLNDGLIGYWAESSTGALTGNLITPETRTDAVSDPSIDTFSGSNNQYQTRSFADDPLALSMLIDPRGLVHATTGILPTKAISIPQEYWLPALEKMAFWFFTSPILQPKMTAKVSMNLPKIQGYDWKWWDIKNGEEIIVSDNGVMASNELNQLRDGWLYLKPQPITTNNG